MSKDTALIGTVSLDDGARLSVLVAGDGAPIVSIDGVRHPMKRPTAVEVARLFRAAAEHEPHRGVRSGR